VTHILPGSDKQGTLDHMDFYLSCLRLLAGKKPVQTLFTVDDQVELAVVRLVGWGVLHRTGAMCQ
jgi:hypothetical protein